MKHGMALIAVVLLVVVVGSGLAQTAPSLQGTWKVTDVVVTGAGATTNTTPQPSLYLFTKQHYSIVFVRGTSPRKPVADPANPAKLTDAEKMARYDAYDAFTANTGTYEVKGATVTTHPVVAKNPGFMGTTQTRDFKIVGTTL